MRNTENMIIKLRSIIILWTVILSCPLLSFGQIMNGSQQKDITFEIEISQFQRTAPKIKNSLYTEEMIFISSDKVKVVVLVAYYKSVEDAKKAVRERIEDLNNCGEEDTVFDAKNNEIGVRYVCSANKNYTNDENKVIYTYGRDLYEVRSLYIKHLEIFEKKFCPRSNKILGRKCPEIYLKENWLTKEENQK